MTLRLDLKKNQKNLAILNLIILKQLHLILTMKKIKLKLLHQAEANLKIKVNIYCSNHRNFLKKIKYHHHLKSKNKSL